MVLFYENGEFYLELGLGGMEGKYTIKSDTIFLNYYENSGNWPKKLLISENYFVPLYADKILREMRIKRDQ